MDEFRETARLIIQWAIFAGALLVYLVGAGFNGWIAWREWVKGEPDGPSIAPIIAGAIGVVAVLAFPVGTIHDRVPYIWIPLVLDCGSAPYLLLVIYSVIKDRNR
jgi:uncharacterized membrane protein